MFELFTTLNLNLNVNVNFNKLLRLVLLSPTLTHELKRLTLHRAASLRSLAAVAAPSAVPLAVRRGAPLPSQWRCGIHQGGVVCAVQEKRTGKMTEVLMSCGKFQG